jgi:hypothetical protein
MIVNSRPLSIRRASPEVRQSTASRSMLSLPLCVLGFLLASAGLVESKASAPLRALQERIASNHHRLVGKQLRSRWLRSAREFQPSNDREPTLLRGYNPKESDVALLASLGRRRLNMRTLKQMKQCVHMLGSESNGFFCLSLFVLCSRCSKSLK